MRRMKKTSGIIILIFFCSAMLANGCKEKATSLAGDDAPQTRTPVTVTTMSYDNLQEYIELNATATFLLKNYVRSNLNGYVVKADVKAGEIVKKGQLLFLLKTKEAQAIGNTINSLDPSLNFSGLNKVYADAAGFISEVNHQQGDYVQDGEPLATISDSKSFVFAMNVPFEDNPYVSIGKSVELVLPDLQHFPGTISYAMPVMDSVSQTQTYAVTITSRAPIPQNLVAIARILKSAKQNAPTLPKNSVLSNETQTDFWVMKMINDTTAVKVPVKKGVESGDKVEILSPQFSPNDKILVSGNYGLPDTALVIVNKSSDRP